MFFSVALLLFVLSAAATAKPTQMRELYEPFKEFKETFNFPFKSDPFAPRLHSFQPQPAKTVPQQDEKKPSREFQATYIGPMDENILQIFNHRTGSERDQDTRPQQDDYSSERDQDTRPQQDDYSSERDQDIRPQQDDNESCECQMDVLISLTSSLQGCISAASTLASCTAESSASEANEMTVTAVHQSLATSVRFMEECPCGVTVNQALGTSLKHCVHAVNELMKCQQEEQLLLASKKRVAETGSESTDMKVEAKHTQSRHPLSAFNTMRNRNYRLNYPLVDDDDRMRAADLETKLREIQSMKSAGRRQNGRAADLETKLRQIQSMKSAGRRQNGRSLLPGSCDEIKRLNPRSQPGYYTIADSEDNQGEIAVYCSMD